jgi:hypothetical protein
MNLGTARTYNNENYDVLLKVYTSDITLTSPSDIESNDDNCLLIPAENLSYIMFENSIVDIIPKAEFELLDEGFALTSKLKQQNTRFRTIIKKDGGSPQENISLDLFWIVKKFDILSISTNGIQYKIWADLDCAVPLYTICQYATENPLHSDTSGAENPFKIIRSILLNSGFALYPDGGVDSSGNKIKNRYSSPSCQTKVNFITNQNMYTIDAVKYLLSVAVGTLDVMPPAYLIFNMKDNKGFVTTRENLFKESSIKMQPQSISFYYSITDSTIGRQFQMRDIRTDSAREELGGIESSKMFYNHNFYQYDHKERAWGNDKVNKFSINDLLTKGSTPSDGSLFLKNASEDLELSKYYQYPTIHGYKMYEILRELELFSSNIQFSIDGDLNLDVGHVISIRETDAYEKREMFNGKWMVVKVRHSFRNKEYKTNLICSRTYYSKA